MMDPGRHLEPMCCGVIVPKCGGASPLLLKLLCSVFASIERTQTLIIALAQNPVQPLQKEASAHALKGLNSLRCVVHAHSFLPGPPVINIHICIRVTFQSLLGCCDETMFSFAAVEGSRDTTRQCTILRIMRNMEVASFLSNTLRFQFLHIEF